MNFNAPLQARAQLAEGCKPGARAFVDPAVAPKPTIALDAFASYAVLDTAAFEMSTEPRLVVSLVCMQLAGPAARSAWLAAHRWQGVNQLISDHRIVMMGCGNAKHQRDALAVRDEMALAAKFSSVRGIGAGHAGPINADPAEVDLAGAAQFVQKQQMQVVPRLRCLPITKAPPAVHTAAQSQFLG